MLIKSLSAEALRARHREADRRYRSRRAHRLKQAAVSDLGKKHEAMCKAYMASLYTMKEQHK